MGRRSMWIGAILGIVVPTAPSPGQDGGAELQELLEQCRTLQRQLKEVFELERNRGDERFVVGKVTRVGNFRQMIIPLDRGPGARFTFSAEDQESRLRRVARAANPLLHDELYWTLGKIGSIHRALAVAKTSDIARKRLDQMIESIMRAHRALPSLPERPRVPSTLAQARAEIAALDEDIRAMKAEGMVFAMVAEDSPLLERDEGDEYATVVKRLGDFCRRLYLTVDASDAHQLLDEMTLMVRDARSASWKG